MDDNTEMLEVYCGSMADVDFVKSILEGEGIQIFLGNDSLGSWVPIAGEMANVRIYVREEDWERADALIADLEDHLYGEKEDQEEEEDDEEN